MNVDAKTSEGVGGRVDPDPGAPSVAPFLELSRDLRDTLVPIQPRPQFRAQLHLDLIAAARRQEALRKLGLGAEAPDSSPGRAGEYGGRILQRLHLSPGQISRRWVVGAAAAGSAASLVGVGVVAYVRRRRGRTVA